MCAVMATNLHAADDAQGPLMGRVAEEGCDCIKRNTAILRCLSAVQSSLVLLWDVSRPVLSSQFSLDRLKASLSSKLHGSVCQLWTNLIYANVKAGISVNICVALV